MTLPVQLNRFTNKRRKQPSPTKQEFQFPLNSTKTRPRWLPNMTPNKYPDNKEAKFSGKVQNLSTLVIRSRGLSGWDSAGESISMLSTMTVRQKRNSQSTQHREWPNPELSLPRFVCLILLQFVNKEVQNLQLCVQNSEFHRFSNSQFNYKPSLNAIIPKPPTILNSSF